MRECDCVPGHVCDCWAYRGDPALAADWDKAVEDIHRAFCYPEHEKVGVWDKQMVESLRRNGYVIAKASDIAGWAHRQAGHEHPFDECPSRDDWVSVASLGIVG